MPKWNQIFLIMGLFLTCPATGSFHLGRIWCWWYFYDDGDILNGVMSWSSFNWLTEPQRSSHPCLILLSSSSSSSSQWLPLLTSSMRLSEKNMLIAHRHHDNQPDKNDWVAHQDPDHRPKDFSSKSNLSHFFPIQILNNFFPIQISPIFSHSNLRPLLASQSGAHTITPHREFHPNPSNPTQL